MFIKADANALSTKNNQTPFKIREDIKKKRNERKKGAREKINGESGAEIAGER